VEAQHPEKNGGVSGQATAHERLHALCAHPEQNPLTFVIQAFLTSWTGPSWAGLFMKTLDGYDTTVWSKNQG
jgi:hypothetical protein